MSHVVEPVIRLVLQGQPFILSHDEARALVVKLQQATGDTVPAGVAVPTLNPPAGRREDLNKLMQSARAEIASEITRLRCPDKQTPLTEMSDGYFSVRKSGTTLRIPVTDVWELLSAAQNQTADTAAHSVNAGDIWVSRLHFADNPKGKYGLQLASGAVKIQLDADEAKAMVEHLQESLALSTVTVLGPTLEVAEGCLQLPTPTGLIKCTAQQTEMIHRILGYIVKDPEKPRDERTDGLVIAYPMPGSELLRTVGITGCGGHVEFEVREAKKLWELLTGSIAGQPMAAGQRSATGTPLVVLDGLEVGGRRPGRAVFTAGDRRVMEVPPAWLVEVAALYRSLGPERFVEAETSHGAVTCFHDRIELVTPTHQYAIHGENLKRLLRHGQQL